jgi:hypothetical protein
MYTILENGEQFDLTTDEFKGIEVFVYYCPNCLAYHVKEENIEQFMDAFRSKVQQLPMEYKGYTIEEDAGYGYSSAERYVYKMERKTHWSGTANGM